MPVSIGSQPTQILGKITNFINSNFLFIEFLMPKRLLVHDIIAQKIQLRSFVRRFWGTPRIFQWPRSHQKLSKQSKFVIKCDKHLSQIWFWKHFRFWKKWKKIFFFNFFKFSEMAQICLTNTTSTADTNECVRKN